MVVPNISHAPPFRLNILPETYSATKARPRIGTRLSGPVSKREQDKWKQSTSDDGDTCLVRQKLSAAQRLHS